MKKALIIAIVLLASVQSVHAKAYTYEDVAYCDVYNTAVREEVSRIIMLNSKRAPEKRIQSTDVLWSMGGECDAYTVIAEAKSLKKEAGKKQTKALRRIIKTSKARNQWLGLVEPELQVNEIATLAQRALDADKLPECEYYEDEQGQSGGCLNDVQIQALLRIIYLSTNDK